MVLPRQITERGVEATLSRGPCAAPTTRRFAILIAVLACVAGAHRPVDAQEPTALARGTAGVLTLDSVLILIDTRSPRVRAADALARATGARVAAALRPPDPELQLGLMNYSLPKGGPDPVLGMTQLQVMQMVPIPGKLSAAGAAARARADAASARALDVAWEVRAGAAMAFYERYQSAGSAALARETRRLLEDVAAIASAMYRVGEGRQSDVLRARVEIARMDEEIVRMEAMQEAATARLAAMADTTSDVVAGAPQLPVFPDSVPSLDALEQLAVETRPMLAAGAAEVRAASADVRLARRELWPDLQVGLQYGQRRMDMGIDRMGSLMIGATLPVFAGARQLRMREESAAMRQMAVAELSSMRAETRNQLSQIRITLSSTRRLRDLYTSSVLPQAEAATAAALSAYRTGAVDFMTVIENRMSVNRYRQELFALDAAEGRAWVELEMVLGRVIVSRPLSAFSTRPRSGGRP